ncbi:MAG: ATP-dependent DNA helicase RecG [Rickettsiales bacterium]|jgi:ATP-dependent DNA helicase RecG|nr:ATP-dependent DNA helicase RecG [Rickettsiales bacterium]
MRQELYDFLKTDLQFVKGVGPVLAGRFDEFLGGRRILDFLLHIPRAVKSRPPVESVLDATAGDIITIPLEIRQIKKGVKLKSGRWAPTQVFGYDKLGGQVVIQFFGQTYLDYWLEKLPVGDWRMVSGKLEPFGERFTITHPDFIEPLATAARIPSLQAIYPLGAGLTQKIMASVRDQIFASPLIANAEMPIIDLLKAAHYAESDDDLAPSNETIQRLAYDELFASQLAIATTRKNRDQGQAARPAKTRVANFSDKLRLPFELTASQKRTIEEIKNDMAGARPMMRLVQGDVGSGKTIVALIAALWSLDFGGQSVLLAPTDALAQQHFAKIKPMCDELGIVCDILTGRDKGTGRHEKLVSLKSGRTKIAIGTHALFQDDVEYKNLSLAVIDEQHRFGVAQRALMAAKGSDVDILALSATPIPRTLSMTIYGDMDISIINEKPAGRLPIITTALPTDRIAALVERMKYLLAPTQDSLGRQGLRPSSPSESIPPPQAGAGKKAFWVCPLVEESEESDMMNVETRFGELRRHFKAGLIHGQMPKTERDKVMADFASGDLQVLVATSVIEVGIDVPAAVVMVIENAERFGLSALHQIRGRVGRGDAQSYCILLHGPRITEDGQKRLAVLCESEDGFYIAEKDLMMRGVGEILGVRQSGWLDYHFVDYREHQNLFKFAVEKAKEMAASDSVSDEARDLMWIFGQSEKVDFIKG